MLSAAAAVLAPVGGFADTAPPSSTGLRTFRVYVEDCLQVTLRCPDAQAAMIEAEAYRQPGDDLAVWEGSRLVGTVTAATPIRHEDAGLPAAHYNDDGIPKSVAFFGPGNPPAPLRGSVVLKAQGDNGYFMFIDRRPPEQLDAIDRFTKGDRSPETWELVLASLSPCPA